MQVDLGDDPAVRQLFRQVTDRLGGIDVLHLNAADASAVAGEVTGIAEVSDETWNRILRLNPTGFFYASRAAIPAMIAGGGGSIIMTSTTGAIRSEMCRGTYGLSKAAVDGLMRAVTTAYGKHGIRCNSILPGAMLTPEYRAGPRQWPKPIIDNHLKHGLLPRIGNENDIANAAVFLASDESGYITGHQLVVDGGLTVHMPHMVDEMAIAADLATLYTQ